MHVEGDYAFVHAGIRPGIALERQDPHDLLWIREPFLGSLARHGRTIVHGHTIRPLPEVRTNRIGIDTGAFYSGRLTALVLDGASRDFLTT
jgi:serine/threonine protein phosphatase 1